MNSNFYINNIFESNLEFGWNFTDYIFSTNGQEIIIQHLASIQLVKKLNSYEHLIINMNDSNYLEIEYRWSFDNVSWTQWIYMPLDFNNFPENVSDNIWFEIKYKYISNNIETLELKTLELKGERNSNEIFQVSTINPGDTVVYTNQDTYKVFSLTDFQIFLQDDNVQDLNINIRYTQTQGRQWSDWVPLNKENLQKLRIERIKFCNFQFSFQNIGNIPVNLYDLELIGEFQNITANYATTARYGLKTQCNPLVNSGPATCADDLKNTNGCTPCSEAYTPWNSNIENCTTSCNSFVQMNDKNLWKEQIKLYAELTDFINQVNSWKVTYLLTDADGKGIDHLLHEQQIHNVIAMKDLNIIVPSNQFPTDTLHFSGLDLDLIQSFEIHITKESFKRTFGVEFRPSKRDVVYMCDINQLWEVEQMFPKRGFMNAEIYYRVLMKKYSDRKSRQFAKNDGGQEAKSFIDSIVKYTTFDSLFGINVEEETKKITNDSLAQTAVENPSEQYTPKSSMKLRSNLHNKANIIDSIIWNASLTVAKSTYKMPIKSKNLKLVEYTNLDQSMNIADNRAISFWFKTEQYDPTYDWTILSNFDYDNNLGYKVNMFQGALTLQFNANVYSLPIAALQADVWYVILINLDQVQSKLEIAIYNRQSEIGSDLDNSQLVLFNKIILDIVPDYYTHASNIFIGGSNIFMNTNNTKNWYITNLRIFDTCIDKSKRTIVLNENVISDTDLTILVDNAEVTPTFPKYGNF